MERGGDAGGVGLAGEGAGEAGHVRLGRGGAKATPARCFPRARRRKKPRALTGKEERRLGQLGQREEDGHGQRGSARAVSACHGAGRSAAAWAWP